MAWYIAVPPALSPIMVNNCRREIPDLDCPVIIFHLVDRCWQG
jgi:hypothetical protein